jgi:3-oxoadipate enol-lactonase
VTLYHELTGPEHAPVVVLSNSLGTDTGLWDGQLSRLRESFRVLRYDQRGHGRSSASPASDLKRLGTDVLDLLDHYGLTGVHYAGVSIGGMIGMWLAENAPERIDRLALVCTSSRLDPAGWWERAARVRAGGTEPLVQDSLLRWFTEPYARRPGVAEKFGDMIRSCDPESYAACCEAIATMDIEPRLNTITAATLVIAGRDDPATPPDHGRRIAHAIRDARLEVLPDAAHLANAEQVEPVNRLLLDHFGA